MAQRARYVLLSVCVLFFFAADALAQTVFERGLKEFQEENYEEALDALLKARALEPTSTQVAFFIGLTYKRMEKYSEAIPYLRDAITYTPKVKEALVELVDALYQTNQLEEAERWIAVGEKEGVATAGLEFTKGLILLKTGKFRQAVGAFEKAKDMDKSFAQAAEFQIANAYLSEGRTKEARDRFRFAITLDPRSDIGTYANDYEKFLTEKIEKEKPWHFSIGLGYKYDTNVVTKPMSGAVAETITNEKDNAINTTFRTSYTAPFSFSTPYSLTALYSLYSDQYFHGTNDILSQSIVLMPGYNMARVSFSLPVTYGYTWLSDKRYMQMIGASPTVRFLVNPSNMLDLSYGFSWKHYAQALEPGIQDSEESREAYNYNGSVGWTYFTAKKGVISLRYTLSKENADGVNWTYWDHHVGASLVHPIFTDKLKIQISGDVDFIEYENVHSVYNIKRRDDTYSFSAGPSYEILKNLDIVARYTHTRNKSNIEDVYGYKREIFFTGLEYNF